MSKYRRDDQKFREQIIKLADAGLRFPTAPAEVEQSLVGAPGSLGPGTGRKSAYAEAYRTRGMSEATDYEIKPKGKFPEVVAGVVMGIVVLGIIALAILAGLGLVTLLGGAR